MELIIRDSFSSSSLSKSRSPSLGAVSASATPTGQRNNRRKITVIDGNFQSQNDLDRSQTPPPFLNPNIPSPRHSGTPSTDSLRPRAMTSPPVDLRNGRDSRSMSHLDVIRAPSPSLSWRSSTSSIADTAVSSLIQPPSSEHKILQDIKKQMTQSFLHSKSLEREVSKIPKLRSDLQAMYREREKLMNELLEQRAIVLQLKQRVSLLHEQNQELAKLAKSDSSSNKQVLAIRNTLVTTMAQLKQMEDQVQGIPLLRSQIRELEEQVKEAEIRGGDRPRVPSDLPEGVSSETYVSLLEENQKLKSANARIMEEMKSVSKHLSAVTENCDSIQSRMEQFHSSQNTSGPLQERIKKLEDEKSSLYQELVDAKYRNDNETDVDLAHLKKEVRSVKKANSRLRAKIESMKMESRTQKEQLVLKLFEIESLNVKTSKYEMEKQLLEMEQVQVQSEGSFPSSPSAAAAAGSTSDDPLRELSPDGRALILRFQQLEVHSHEMQSVIKTFVSERQEMESKIAELTARLNETAIDDLQRQIEESDSKLVIARERIRQLEETITRRSLSPEIQGVEDERDSLKRQVKEMKVELRRLSVIEQQVVAKESAGDELVETREKFEKTKIERDRLSRKVKEGRSRLKSLAGDLKKSAELVEIYQGQCTKMEKEMSE
ncbi:PREDICTED: myosin-14-like, partial [Amphimedon queenslandica]|uniref:Uncharacterized protein n=2 Tax=Amphimedon queenslandica TaxID=400682 RepID=A0AAN0IRV6_AMPQE